MINDIQEFIKKRRIINEMENNKIEFGNVELNENVRFIIL